MTFIVEPLVSASRATCGLGTLAMSDSTSANRYYELIEAALFFKVSSKALYPAPHQNQTTVFRQSAIFATTFLGFGFGDC